MRNVLWALAAWKRSGGKATMRRASRLIRDERGATAIEYGLIMALVFLAIIGSVQAMTDKTIAMWGNVANNMETNG